MAIGGINLTYGGPLNIISNANSRAFASGDSFPLVTKSSGNLSGWFSSVTLPALATGIAWDTNNLATSGVLDVYTFTTTNITISMPMNSNAVISATKQATNGMASVTAVPEPVNVVLGLLGFCAVTYGVTRRLSRQTKVV